MGTVLSAVIRTIAPCLADQAKYITGLKDNVRALEDAILMLEARNADVLAEVGIQERQGLRPLREVQVWLSDVEAIEPQVLYLLDASAAEIRRLSMHGYYSNDFCSTYSYGKEVCNKLKIVERLLSLSKRRAVEIVARRDLPPDVLEEPTRHTVGLENMLESIWKRLMEEEVGKLGLYGMGGVGKTTLLEQINNKFLEGEHGFDVVISVVVSQDLQIGRIQKEIADRLSLYNQEWERKTKNAKALDIKKVLTRKKFVILLDDIWRKVDLVEIGIPLPPTKNSSKVVFTTRSREVCGYMGADVEMEVKCLEPENAWILFRKKVRANTLASDPMILKLARKLCGKCKGLPLAINVLGETMASKTTVREWQHAIDVLDSYAAQDWKFEDEVLRIVMFSYDDLKDESVKQCFLYCALYPEDHKIEKEILVEYWICEGIIVGDREKAMNHGYGIIGVLVNACLLMNYEDTEKVIMHDVVRQTALWIASNCGKEKENFVVGAGAELHQMPEVGDWKAVRRMSLQNSEIKNISVTPDCSNLTTLLLQGNKLVKISGEFFLSMPKLVVLDLSSNENLNKLPEEVSMLVSLQYLNLAETELKVLPEGLRRLTKLKYLNLYMVYTLRSISVISSLVNLETLLLLHNSIVLSMELIEEIQSLKNLKVLSVNIKDARILDRLLSIPRLANCIQDISVKGIVVKVLIAKARDCTASLCSLMINGGYMVDIVGRTSLKAVCFQNLKEVRIMYVEGIRDLTCLLFAPNLTSLLIFVMSDLREIISREAVSGIMDEGGSIIPFQKLDTLYLHALWELRSIYWEPLDFPCLKKITIGMCPELKKLPINKKSAEGNQISLFVDSGEWFEQMEWEDEATKTGCISHIRFLSVRHTTPQLAASETTHVASYQCLSRGSNFSLCFGTLFFLG